MTGGQLTAVVQQVRRLAGPLRVHTASDAELLRLFTEDRDSSAFATLVERHSGLVWSVCRAVLRHQQDAEDAFQATFLVLARKAGTIRKGEALASWLFGVAQRIAVRNKTDAARRRTRERQARNRVAEQVATEVGLRELQAVLHEEVSRLPPKLRMPFVLCCMEGKSKPAAARALGWKQGTVSGRLAQARKLLQQRLVRRGVALSATLCALSVSQTTAGAVSAALARSTVRAVSAAASAGVVSVRVAVLAEGAIQTMIGGKIKRAALILFLCVVVATGSLLAQRTLLAWPVEPATASAQGPAAAPGKPGPAPAAPATDDRPDPILVKGRVLGPDGKPFSGATLSVLTTNDATDLPIRTTSGKDGHFEIKLARSELIQPKTKLPGREFTLVASANDLAADWLTLTDRQSGAEQTLRLVKDDVPLTGRLLSLEGQPIVGARVRIHTLRAAPGGDLTAYLDAVKSGMFRGHLPETRRWFGGLPGQPATVLTDKAGRFRLTGLGRERLVELAIEGKGIHHTLLTAMTRKGPEVVGPVTRHDPHPQRIYGSNFEHLVAPARLITGTVREKSTGKPLAGATVTGLGTLSRAVTDDQGHYELEGYRKGQEYALFALPRADEPYFITSVSAPDPAGLGPVTVNMEMKRGIIVRGKLTDKQTGKPVAGEIQYFPLYPNASVREVPGPGAAHAVGAFSEALTKPDGSFMCIVLPGPGALVVRADPDRYAQASVDPKAFFKSDPREHMTYGSKDSIHTASGDGMAALPQDQFQAIVLLEPTRDAKAIEHDIALEPARRLKGTILAPDGKPLSGARIRGLGDSYDWKTLEGTAEFSLHVPPAARSRTLYVQHEQQRLAGVLEVQANARGPLVVRLQPWATVTGRLMTSEGQPMARVELYSGSGKKGEERKYGNLPIHFRTDENGKFRIDSLLPGTRYNLIFSEDGRENGMAGYLVQDLILSPGQSKDLGDVKAEPFKRE